MDSLSVAKKIREYFELTLNSSTFQIEIKSTKKFEHPGNAPEWKTEIILKPYFGKEAHYNFILNNEGNIIEVIKLT